MKDSKAKGLLLFFVACYAVAFVASIITRPEIPSWYEHIAKPSWRPPNWLFGPVWTLLYGMIAVAGWRVWKSPESSGRTWALRLFWLQLTMNFLWSPVFFRFHRIGLGVLVIGTLWLIILLFALVAWRVARPASILFVPYLLWVSFASLLNYTIWTMNPQTANRELPTAVAWRLTSQLEHDGFPSPAEWNHAPAYRFENDWQGKNPDPQRATEVRLIWTPDALFIRFVANYRTISVFPDSRADGWRDEMWDRDVAEVFLQPDASDPWIYKEFEVSPTGQWIDLALSHGEKSDLKSNLKRRVVLNDKAKKWTAELMIPMTSLTPHFDPSKPWRANFYRIEGESEPRFYAAWSPTYTPQPSFHQPDFFGHLRFAEKK